MSAILRLMVKNWMALIFLLVALGCTYAPDEVFFVELSSTPATGAVSLNEVETNDTIRLYTGQQFSYSIEASAALLRVEVLLDGQLIIESNTPTGEFFIPSPLFKSGTFELKVVATTRSGTNSLADITGNEKVEIWGKWVLIIDIEPPPVPVLTMTVENRFATFHWTPFKRGSFMRYELQTYFGPIVFTNPNDTTWVDSTYSEGKYRNYQVTTYAANNHSQSIPLELHEPQSLEATLERSDSTVRLIWRKSKYANFKDLKIMENSTVRDVITNPNDTSYVLKLKEAYLGSVTTFAGISISARYPMGQPTAPLFESARGIDFPACDGRVPSLGQYHYCTSRQLLMASDRDSKIRFYNGSMELVDSVQINDFLYDLPPLVGTYIYYTVGNGVGQLNLQTKEERTFETPGHQGVSIPPVAVSANENVVSYYFYDFTDSQDKRVINTVRNLETSETLYHTDKPYDPNLAWYPMVLSPDGVHGMIGAELFAITGSTFTSTELSLPTGYGLPFRPDKGDEIFFPDTDIQILSAYDLSIKRTISSPKEGLVWKEYDPVTKRMRWSNDDKGEHYLVHIDTNDVVVVKAVPYQVLSFINGTLFTINGQYKKIL